MSVGGQPAIKPFMGRSDGSPLSEEEPPECEKYETQLCGDLTASEQVVHQLREDAQMQHEELQELRQSSPTAPI